MRRAHLCAVLGFGLMLATASSEARELALSADFRVGGDNNIFRTGSNRVADGFIEISPRASVRESRSTLNYDFDYRPTYEAFVDTSGVDGFDHQAGADLTWRPTPIDTLGFISNYRNYRTLRFGDESSPLDPVPDLEQSDRLRIQRADARVFYSRMLTSTFSVQTSLSFDDVDYDRGRNVDSRALTGRIGTQYAVSPKTTIGLSGSARRRRNRGLDSLNQFSTRTDIVDVAASIQRSLSPTMDVSIQAGPSFIRTKQEAPPIFPPGFDSKDRTVSFFAYADLEKRWRRSTADLSYTRSESDSGGTSSSSIVDVVVLKIDHRFDQRWSLHAEASWNRRKEIVAVGTSRRVKFTQYSASFLVSRKISRQLSVVGHYSYRTQDQSGSSNFNSIGDLHLGFLSLRYTFDPIVF